MDSYNSDFESLDENEARLLKKQISKYIKSYSNKSDSISDKDWLKAQFKEDFPELSDEQAAHWADESFDSVVEYNRELQSLDEAASKGQSKEQWFAGKVAEASAGVSVIQQGRYLQSVDDALTKANEQMMQAVSTGSGAISQNPQLDGFIAEQHHVNTFNARAALQGSQFKAEVLTPAPGATYGKNSVDVVIKNTDTGKIVHRYQMKYGKDARSTIQYIREGNYSNQRIVVPPDQVEEVQQAFPSKTVTAEIGGTSDVPVHSDPLTKSQAKEQQEKLQKSGSFDELSWNVFSTKEAALAIGKKAGMLGLGAGAFAGGFELIKQVADGEGIDTEKVVETAVTTGADAGIKTAVTGAVKASAEKGYLKIIPKGTPAATIGNIVCLSIENAKILAKVAKGELSVSQGMDRMGRTSTAMVFGLKWGAVSTQAGAVIGGIALSGIPVVGPAIGAGLGGLIGGVVGYMAGSSFGSSVYEGVKKIHSCATNALKSTWSAIRAVGNRIKAMVTY